MLYICVTLDYELFMGENHLSEDEVLITPTNSLLATLDKAGVKATFFADVCFPLSFKNSDYKNQQFIYDMEGQMRDIVMRGHDVQLHIHPHWYHAKYYDNGNVEFDPKYYRVHNYGFNKTNKSSADSIITDGIRYLNDLLTEADGDYKCIAYRAGGFCLQPEKELIKALTDAGIKIDSSVAMFFDFTSENMFYHYKLDFNNNVNFFMSDEYGLEKRYVQKIKNNMLFEIPVGGYKTFPVKNFISKMNAPLAKGRMRGSSMKTLNSPTSNSKILKLKARINGIVNNPLMMSFDFYGSDSLSAMVKRFAKENKYKNRDIFISLIGHPKMLYDTHLENLGETLSGLKKDPFIDFITMQDACKILKLD